MKNVPRVSCYAKALDILRKTDEELKLLPLSNPMYTISNPAAESCFNSNSVFLRMSKDFA